MTDGQLLPLLAPAPIASERIPFHRTALAGRELEYLAQAASHGALGGDGPFALRCQELLEEELGATRVLLTPSCTHALELAALLLGLGAGDEVVLPAFTFVSTANAFALRGARLVFVDVREDTLNLDERLVASAIGERTRAVVAVHYAGVACEVDEIRRLARGVPIVEDSAHALFASSSGRALGTLGALGALSFHATKNVTCGEGGALVVNEATYLERAEILREKGTDRSRFLRGDVGRYTWQGVGSSYLLSELQAAFLLAQLEGREEIQRRRRTIWERYARELDGWCRRRGARLPVVPTGCRPAYHLFHLLMPDREERDRLIAHLAARGVEATFHFLPLHLSPMGRRLGGRRGDHPVTESVADRLVRLPLYPGLAEGEQARVLEAVLELAP